MHAYLSLPAARRPGWPQRLALLTGAAVLAAGSGPAVAHPGHDDPAPVPAPAPISEPPTYGARWKPGTPIAGGPRQEHSVVSIGRYVYVLGGIAPNPAGGFLTTDRVEVYDTKRESWADASAMPVAMNHPNAAVVDGKIYVVGGLDGGASWEAIPDTFVYDPATDEWTVLEPMPVGHERGSAAMGVDGSTIYLAGGMQTLTPGPGGLQETVADVSTYDVRTGAWGSLPDLPQARDHVGGAIVGDTFYVLGGRDSGQVNVRDTVYALDLRTRQWVSRAPMPTARGGIATAVVGDVIYTFGGEGNPAPGSSSVYSETEAYDTECDTWRRLAPMPRPRHGTAAAAVGNVVHIPGGGDLGGGSPTVVNDTYRAVPTFGKC